MKPGKGGKNGCGLNLGAGTSERCSGLSILPLRRVQVISFQVAPPIMETEKEKAQIIFRFCLTASLTRVKDILGESVYNASSLDNLFMSIRRSSVTNQYWPSESLRCIDASSCPGTSGPGGGKNTVTVTITFGSNVIECWCHCDVGVAKKLVAILKHREQGMLASMPKGSVFIPPSRVRFCQGIVSTLEFFQSLVRVFRPATVQITEADIVAVRHAEVTRRDERWRIELEAKKAESNAKKAEAKKADMKRKARPTAGRVGGFVRVPPSTSTDIPRLRSVTHPTTTIAFESNAKRARLCSQQQSHTFGQAASLAGMYGASMYGHAQHPGTALAQLHASAMQAPFASPPPDHKDGARPLSPGYNNNRSYLFAPLQHNRLSSSPPPPHQLGGLQSPLPGQFNRSLPQSTRLSRSPVVDLFGLDLALDLLENYAAGTNPGVLEAQMHMMHITNTNNAQSPNYGQ